MDLGFEFGLSLAASTALSSVAPIVLDQAAFFPASTPSGMMSFKPFDAAGNEVDITGFEDLGTGTLIPSIVDCGLVFNGPPSSDNGRQIRVPLRWARRR